MQLLEQIAELFGPCLYLCLMDIIAFLEPGKLHEKKFQRIEFGKGEFAGQYTDIDGCNVRVVCQIFFNICG